MMVRKSVATLLAITAALGLAGCDWFTATTSRDTQMRNVEILPGTASDEMITLDQASGDGTAIDTSVATGPAPPRDDSVAAATTDDSAAGGAAADTPAGDSGLDGAARGDGGGAAG